MNGPAMTAAIAQRLYDERRTRDELFGADAGGFGEPAWDMILALAAAGDAPVPAAELIEDACAPDGAVAARYLEWLITRGLVARDDDGSLELSSRGRARFEAFVDGLAH